MVFPSVSLYLDPPNWHQAQNDQQAVGTGGGGGRNPSLPPPPPQETHHMGQARPGSMADRARMASIPQPEAGLKCPRCESTNTKFCYFNNYSLLQPRHFCKTCRRYWTRGGALRSVPVGGGCRRNKRSSKRRSSNRSKSPSVSNSQEPPSQQQAQPPQLLVTDNGSGSTRSGVPEMFNMGHNHLPQLEPPHIPFMASLHNFGQYGINENIGLNIGGGMLNQAVPTSAATGGGAGGGGSEQWRLMGQMQQFPFLGGFEQANNLYAFQGDENHQPSVVGEGNLEVKMEENQNQGMNLTSQFPGITSANSEYWGGGNKWVNLSGGLGSSSTGGANMIR